MPAAAATAPEEGTTDAKASEGEAEAAPERANEVPVEEEAKGEEAKGEEEKSEEVKELSEA